MSFGDRVKKLRLKNNMTQEDLSKMLNVSRATAGRYETNKRFPDMIVLKRVADIFNVSIDYLLERTNDKNVSITNTVSLNKNNNLFDKVEDEVIEKLILAGLIESNNYIPEKLIKNIVRYGIDAAIAIAELENKLNK